METPEVVDFVQAEVSKSLTDAYVGIAFAVSHISFVGKAAIMYWSPLTLATRQAKAIRRVVKAILFEVTEQ